MVFITFWGVGFMFVLGLTGKRISNVWWQQVVDVVFAYLAWPYLLGIYINNPEYYRAPPVDC